MAGVDLEMQEQHVGDVREENIEFLAKVLEITGMSDGTVLDYTTGEHYFEIMRERAALLWRQWEQDPNQNAADICAKLREIFTRDSVIELEAIVRMQFSAMAQKRLGERDCKKFSCPFVLAAAFAGVCAILIFFAADSAMEEKERQIATYAAVACGIAAFFCCSAGTTYYPGDYGVVGALTRHAGVIKAGFDSRRWLGISTLEFKSRAEQYCSEGREIAAAQV